MVQKLSAPAMVRKHPDMSGSRRRLPAPSPLRTGLASFDAHGSSLF